MSSNFNYDIDIDGDATIAMGLPSGATGAMIRGAASGIGAVTIIERV